MSNKKDNITKVISVFETFAGIGAQHKAISNNKELKDFFVVKRTSEWDARAVIAYSQIHNKDKFDKELELIKKNTIEKSEKWLDEQFKGLTFSLNSKVPGNVTRKDIEFKQTLLAATRANDNFPNIMEVQGEVLKDINLLTYSFPCQGLSIANMGRAQGIKEDAKSTSNLIWQIKRILDDAQDKHIELPKYLLMENVTALIGKKHIEDYERWLSYLEELNYKTITFTLKGNKHDALQKRERVFALSIQKQYFPKTLNKEGHWKDNMKFFSTLVASQRTKFLSEEQRMKKYDDILDSSPLDELLDSTPNNTPSRHRMAEGNPHLITKECKEKSKYLFNTLTTKQDRHPNIGMIPIKHNDPNKLNWRFITPREAYQIMGFESKDFDMVKVMYEKKIISKESLYRQAGNSIVVNVLEDIFKFVRKIEEGQYE